MGGEVVGAVTEGVDEADEDASSSRVILEKSWGCCRRTVRRGGGAPGALVEHAAEGHPVTEPAVADLGDGCGGGAEVGGGKSGGELGELAAAGGPTAEAFAAEHGQDGGGDAVVLAGGLPRAPGLAGELQAVVCPGLQFVVGELVANGVGGALELGHEGGGVGRELFVVVGVDGLAFVSHMGKQGTESWNMVALQVPSSQFLVPSSLSISFAGAQSLEVSGSGPGLTRLAAAD